MIPVYDKRERESDEKGDKCDKGCKGHKGAFVSQIPLSLLWPLKPSKRHFRQLQQLLILSPQQLLIRHLPIAARIDEALGNLQLFAVEHISIRMETIFTDLMCGERLPPLTETMLLTVEREDRHTLTDVGR